MINRILIGASLALSVLGSGCIIDNNLGYASDCEATCTVRVRDDASGEEWEEVDGDCLDSCYMSGFGHHGDDCDDGPDHQLCEELCTSVVVDDATGEIFSELNEECLDSCLDDDGDEPGDGDGDGDGDGEPAGDGDGDGDGAGEPAGDGDGDDRTCEEICTSEVIDEATGEASAVVDEGCLTYCYAVRGEEPPEPELPPDTDGDGICDAGEEERGTDPENPDTDGDGQSDGEEIACGSSPLDPFFTCPTDGEEPTDGEPTGEDPTDEPPCPCNPG